MLKKIKKIYLYFKACHRGEILKKLEYKIKDKLGYFYIRNKSHNKKNNVSMMDIKINIPEFKKEINENKYDIFGNEICEDDIIKFLETDKKFWRKVKLNQYEDVKIVWEYNRLQFLLPIAMNYVMTKNDEDKNKIIEILDFWKEKNIYEYTVNWNSNLEVAIRAINIALTLVIMQSEDLNKKYSKLLYLHAKHIYSEMNFSNICIPNNHVIGEATALLMLSRILDVKEKKKWENRATNILRKYIDIIDEDGISKENSFSYQYFVTKMYILNLCFVEDKKLFEKFSHKVVKSLKFLKWTIINQEQIFNYGDNDNGFVYSIYRKFNIAKDIQEYYNLFLNNEINQETELYKQIFNKFNSKNKLQKEKKDEEKDFILTKNIFIYKWNDNILFFNAKNIDGHAHNDSLAINLVKNAEEVLLDAGTYSYNKSKEERKIFRGREAHNTIQLEDNAEQIGSFRWINKNRSYISFFKEDEDKIEIEGVIEKLASRRIIIDKKKNEIKIFDKNLNKNVISTNWIMDNESFIEKNVIKSNNTNVYFDENVRIEQKDIYISKQYLTKIKAKLYCIENNSNNKIETTIKIKE